ncbi:hypothetical protein M569_03402 [Genlisea aurea]|uniref:Uncharacterized protein n=1 Tax=Genlisea aurea TaxID=192259 RepID=S8CWX1_9LAMI|nr:hypothetical protein M569_03402 [Genlisea aurea]
MNRISRVPERGKTGSLRFTDNKDDDLALFREMRNSEKERNILLLQNSDELDAPLGTKTGSSPIFNLAAEAPPPVPKSVTADFFNSDNDKNDYDWLLTPPGTPLFPSLEMESHKTVMSQLGTPKAHPTALKSRLANAQAESGGRSNLSSRNQTASPVLNASSGGIRRPSSSGGPGSRPGTPTGRPTLSSANRPTLALSSNKSALPSAAKPSSAMPSKSTPITSARSSRSTTPTRSSAPLGKSTVPPPRSSTPISSRPPARSSTPTSRPMISASKSIPRSSTPTRSSVLSSSTATSTPIVKSPTLSSVSKPATCAVKNPAPTRSSSPHMRPKPWKPSEMPGFSLDAPPNLRTSLPDRPPSANRGRPGAPSSRASSIEPVSNGRIRRQSCSPARGRPPNGVVGHSSGSSVPVPMVNRLQAKANDNVSPALIGTKMVERVINMRKLAPPKNDDRHSPHSSLSGKSSSPDSSGFGRMLSKKSLDMAIRHMDIRRTIPGNLRPLMSNVPASSMYSVRSPSGQPRRTVGVSDSPVATSSNANSEVSVNAGGPEMDDDANSEKVVRSPASLRGR